MRSSSTTSRPSASRSCPIRLEVVAVGADGLDVDVLGAGRYFADGDDARHLQRVPCELLPLPGIGAVQTMSVRSW